MNLLLGYISVEDPRHLIEDRLLSRFARVSGNAIRSKQLSYEDHERIAQAVSKTREAGPTAGFITSCIPGATDSDVVREMARLVRVMHCDAIFVDYAQAITCSTRTENTRLEVRTIASRIKAAASRLGVPVWLASQLTVERGEGKEPGKHDLRDSRDLAHADRSAVANFAHRCRPTIRAAAAHALARGLVPVRASPSTVDAGRLWPALLLDDAAVCGVYRREPRHRRSVQPWALVVRSRPVREHPASSAAQPLLTKVADAVSDKVVRPHRRPRRSL